MSTLLRSVRTQPPNHTWIKPNRQLACKATPPVHMADLCVRTHPALVLTQRIGAFCHFLHRFATEQMAAAPEQLNAAAENLFRMPN